MMGSSGRCAVVPEGIERGIMDSHLLRIRLPDAELQPRFLARLIDEAEYVRDQIGAAGKGAIMHGLNSSIIKSVVLGAGGEEGAADRAALGAANRPHHPRRHQGPRPDRSHEGLRRRVAGGDSGALGSEAAEGNQ